MVINKVSRENLIEYFKSHKDGSPIYDNPFLGVDKSQLGFQNNVLHLAAQYGSLDMVKYLVEELKVPLFEEDNNGKVPFQQIQYRSTTANNDDAPKVYEYFIGKMKEANELFSKNWEGYSLMDSVIDDINLSVADKKKFILELVQAGADINALDTQGRFPYSPLTRALNSQQNELSKFLIDIGANPELSPTNNLVKPLDICYSRYNQEMSSYIHHHLHPTPMDRDVAVKGLLYAIQENDIAFLEKHFQLPQYRQLTQDGKNLLELAQEKIKDISPEMTKLLEANVVPVKKNIYEIDPNVSFIKENQEKLVSPNFGALENMRPFNGNNLENEENQKRTPRKP